MMDIKEADYSVLYNPGAGTVTFNGTVRLQGLKEYEPLKALLHDAHLKTADGQRLILDMTDLKFLNSSGITTLSMFVIHVRQKANISLTVKGTKKVSWQEKSLLNLNKLWDKATVEITD